MFCVRRKRLTRSPLLGSIFLPPPSSFSCSSLLVIYRALPIRELYCAMCVEVGMAVGGGGGGGA